MFKEQHQHDQITGDCFPTTGLSLLHGQLFLCPGNNLRQALNFICPSSGNKTTLVDSHFSVYLLSVFSVPSNNPTLNFIYKSSFPLCQCRPASRQESPREEGRHDQLLHFPNFQFLLMFLSPTKISLPQGRARGGRRQGKERAENSYFTDIDFVVVLPGCGIYTITVCLA